MEPYTRGELCVELRRFLDLTIGGPVNRGIREAKGYDCSATYLFRLVLLR